MLLKELFEGKEDTFSIKDALEVSNATIKDSELALKNVQSSEQYKKILQICDIRNEYKGNAVMAFMYKGKDSLSHESLFFKITRDGKVQHAYNGKPWNTSKNQNVTIPVKIASELNPVKIYEWIYNKALEEILYRGKSQVNWKREKTQNQESKHVPNAESRLMLKRMFASK